MPLLAYATDALITFKPDALFNWLNCICMSTWHVPVWAHVPQFAYPPFIKIVFSSETSIKR